MPVSIRSMYEHVVLHYELSYVNVTAFTLSHVVVPSPDNNLRESINVLFKEYSFKASQGKNGILSRHKISFFDEISTRDYRSRVSDIKSPSTYMHRVVRSLREDSDSAFNELDLDARTEIGTDLIMSLCGHGRCARFLSHPSDFTIYGRVCCNSLLRPKVLLSATEAFESSVKYTRCPSCAQTLEFFEGEVRALYERIPGK